MRHNASILIIADEPNVRLVFTAWQPAPRGSPPAEVAGASSRGAQESLSSRRSKGPLRYRQIARSF